MKRLGNLMYTAAGAAALAIAASGAALAQDAAIDVGSATYSGNTLTIGSATIPEAGFLAIHSVEDGQIGPVVGHAPLQAGANQSVAVTVDAPIAPGSVFAAMLHDDTNDNGEFEFGQAEGVDTPLTQGGGPVVNRFQIAEGEAVQPVIVQEQDADAGTGTTVGAAGGAVAGAVAGGPVGAIIGAVAGAAAGAALDAPPEPVRTYVVGQEVPSVTLSGDLAVGAGLPDVVVLQPVPDYEYQFAVVNDRRVLVDPATRRVVYIFE